MVTATPVTYLTTPTRFSIVTMLTVLTTFHNVYNSTALKSAATVTRLNFSFAYPHLKIESQVNCDISNHSVTIDCLPNAPTFAPRFSITHPAFDVGFVRSVMRTWLPASLVQPAVWST